MKIIGWQQKRGAVTVPVPTAGSQKVKLEPEIIFCDETRCDC